MSGDNSNPDGPPQEYGAAEPITAHSTGLATAAGGGALLGTTGVAGNLGCALVGDESSAPGIEAALVYAKVQSDTGDSRCATGTYAIQNNPAACPLGTPGRLLPGCAVYKRWDASGTLVARRLAIGGFVTVLNHGQNSGGIVTCDVELGLSFAGGTTIQSSFSFDFNVLGSSESFCVH
jgi:hypothetical protein